MMTRPKTRAGARACNRCLPPTSQRTAIRPMMAARLPSQGDQYSVAVTSTRKETARRASGRGPGAGGGGRGKRGGGRGRSEGEREELVVRSSPEIQEKCDQQGSVTEGKQEGVAESQTRFRGWTANRS